MNNTPNPPPGKEPLLTTIIIVFFRIVFGLIGLLVLLFVLCELNKAYWDYRIREMCKKDGGLHLFESITISHDEFLAWGGQDGVPGVPIPFENENRLDVPIFQRTTQVSIKTHRPHVRKDITEYVRRSDGKILARYEYYARTGGDFPSPAHESSFGCPRDGWISSGLIKFKEKKNEH